MQLQPSELMKPGIVLVLAWFYSVLPAPEIKTWRAIVPAVAKNVYGVVNTPQPGPMSSAINAASSASVPEDMPMP